MITIVQILRTSFNYMESLHPKDIISRKLIKDLSDTLPIKRKDLLLQTSGVYHNKKNTKQSWTNSYNSN